MKKCKLLLALSISLLVPFFALTNVQALTQSRIQTNQNLVYNNEPVGWFNNYAYFTSGSSEVINTEMFGVGPVGYYKTVNVITIGFEDAYTGEIRLDFRGSLANYQMIYPSGENVGAYRWSGSNQVLFVSFINCTSFDVYCYSTTQYTSSNIPAYVSDHSFTTLEKADNTPIVNVAGYQIPIASYTAYRFGCLVPTVMFSEGDIYPYIMVGGTSTETKYSEMVYLDNTLGTTDAIDFVFIAPENSVIAGTTFNITDDTTNFVYELKQIGQNIYGHIYKISFKKSRYVLGRSESGRIEWLQNIKIVPIFYGTRNTCPTEWYGICGYTSWERTLTSIDITLNDIKALLLNNDPPDNYDQDVMDDADDAISGINLIEADFMDDFSDAFSDINLNNYTISSSLNNTVIWLTHNMTEIFSHSGDFQILYTLPLILGIALFFIGRGAVVFRQGNIDRSREHGEATWQRHQEIIRAERSKNQNKEHYSASEMDPGELNIDEIRRKLY